MNQITLNGLEILVLKKVQKSTNKSINKDLLWHSLLGSFRTRATNLDSDIRFLLDKKFITTKDDQISLDIKSELFLKEFDNFEEKEVVSGNYNFAVLKFLYIINEPVPSICFPDIIKKNAAGKFLSATANFEDYLEFNSEINQYVKKNADDLYSINQAGIEYLKNEAIRQNKNIESFIKTDPKVKPFVHPESVEEKTGDNRASAPNDHVSIFGPKTQEPLINSRGEGATNTSYASTRKKIFYVIIAVVAAELIYLLKLLIFDK